MRNIYKALNHLNISDFSLSYEPKTEEEFLDAFSINILDSNGAPIRTTTDPSEFPVTWDQLVVADNLLSLRKVRNNLLAETDWMATSDRILDSDWKVYRQELRDITETYTSLSDVVWPNKPEDN